MKIQNIARFILALITLTTTAWAQAPDRQHGFYVTGPKWLQPRVAMELGNRSWNIQPGEAEGLTHIETKILREEDFSTTIDDQFDWRMIESGHRGRSTNGQRSIDLVVYLHVQANVWTAGGLVGTDVPVILRGRYQLESERGSEYDWPITVTDQQGRVVRIGRVGTDSFHRERVDKRDVLNQLWDQAEDEVVRLLVEGIQSRGPGITANLGGSVAVAGPVAASRPVQRDWLYTQEIGPKEPATLADFRHALGKGDTVTIEIPAGDRRTFTVLEEVEPGRFRLGFDHGRYLRQTEVPSLTYSIE